MKIGNSPDASVSPKADSAAGRKAEAPVKAVTTSASQPAASAQVAISNTAAKLAAGQVEDGSFDAAKVERISRAISEGKFTINANAIADKLVANAQELLSARNNKH